MKRRDFIRLAGSAGIVAFLTDRFGVVRQLLAQRPAPGLAGACIPKFVTPLLVPPAMPRAGKLVVRGGKNIDYYEIAVRQFTQQILPGPLPATTVWGYGPNPATVQGGPVIFNAPSLTIEANYQSPVRIKWINGLVDEEGRYLPHLLPVDRTLHWADPSGASAEAHAFEGPATYAGPVPLITHVHGAVGVGDESDGYAEAWFLPDATNIPDGYATEGPWYDFFKAKASARFDVTWTPGSATFEYPNAHRAATLWYHDHALGLTRLNVYAGPAGFYIVRGGPSDEVLDSRTGSKADLPGPAPAIGDPADVAYYEIPLAIQDRSFNADGSLFYPDTRAFFDELAGPYFPHSDVPPVWNPEFFGDAIMVNGNTWPQLDVARRRYRFRVLNGCQSRFLILDFSGIKGIDVWQIGNEGGFLASPFDISGEGGNRLLMAPAERADLIVDFAKVPPGEWVLRNLGPDEPFGGGEPDDDYEPADPDSTGQILRFNVSARRRRDRSTPPAFLQLPEIAPLPSEVLTRRVALLEEMSMHFPDAPVAALLGTVEGDPNIAPSHWTARRWIDSVTENPATGDTEVWEIYNATADAHPIHIHETTFEVVNRQDVIIDEATETVQVLPGSVPTPPEPWETGRKDTVIAYPGQVTRIRAQFNTPGQYVWHCHIVEHEDNEMMRAYRIGPVQPGQPQ